MSQGIDWASWIAAIAAVGAAVGTVGALWVSVQTARRQQEDHEREHADRISVWMLNDKGPRPAYPVLGNTSGEPAYRCAVSIYDQQTKRKVADYPLVDVLPPDHRESLDWSTPYPAVDWSSVLPVDVAIAFTDRNGARWEREPDGQLRRLARSARSLSGGGAVPP